ncbi:kinesin-like protein KIF26B [Bacillus rossius redtenbacheri]|uniref:kinesin-like protein KIF26B n=1 Tax=Bacillus rossius redtenbacheri TaxID=93214 RepID=UPI002FDCA518
MLYVVVTIASYWQVKVMLRVSEHLGPDCPASLSVDSRRRQVTLVDPSVPAASEDRRLGVAAPKMFAFDAVFTRDESQTEVCSGALTDVIHAVINGTDGCVFCFGHARLGKTHSMVGGADCAGSMGAMPCAISWLFRGIAEQKQRTGSRFSVRVSAGEVAAPAHQLADLLAGHASGTGLPADSDQSPGVYLRDDPLFGTQLQHQSELRASSAERAAYYLDAAVAARSGDAHFFYTLHVYQYNVAGKGGVAGGRSRLHLIDLSSCEKGKASGGIPLSGLGNVLLAIFNGQKHLPYREHKITQLLKECLSSLTCHAAMIAHVSPLAQHYTDTLATIQLASRIHRMRRRKIKFMGGTSTGSGGSSGDETRPHGHENGHSTGSSDVDPSSSEQSADTVIYVGRSDDATDGEHPPVYIPSLNSGDNRCAMGKALRGSGAEHKSTSPAKQKIPNGHVVEDKSSPSHKGGKMAQQAGHGGSKLPTSSHGGSKCSPVRTGKCASTKPATSENTPPLGQSSKIPVPYGCSNGPVVSGSDEQWIDGPRISKSRVVEARNLLKEGGHKKKETWVDGPLQAGKTTAHGAGYGFMDNHKKSMIRKWVENQTTQIQKQTGAKHEPRPPVTGGSTQPALKELTAFKTCNDEVDETSVPLPQDQVPTNVPPSNAPEDNLLLEDEICTTAPEEIDQNQDGGIRVDGNGFSDENKSKSCLFDNLDEKEPRNDNIEGEEDSTTEEKAFSKMLQPCNKEISIDVLTNNFDVRLRILEDNHQNLDHSRDSKLEANSEHKLNNCEMCDPEEDTEEVGDFDDDDDELDMNDVEIIEVEEPLEPVPMQDCCLQVTEEDIALCMAGLDNAFRNVDSENEEEHPLRVLSQENLTVVSTFTDSLSVATDLERNFPRHQFHPATANNSNFSSQRPYSLHELQDNYLEQNRLWLMDTNTTPSCETKRQMNGDVHYRDQLAKLHEAYRSKLAQVGSSRSSLLNAQYRQQPSRCQSLSLNDMLYGSEYNDGQKTDANYGACKDNSSIYSEPVYNHFRHEKTPEAKICDNCKKSLNPAGTSVKLWYQPLLSGSRDQLLGLPKGVHTSLCGKNGHRFCTKLTGSSYNISSLRHPDGASNPDLKEEVKRVPGNGSSGSDRELELKGSHRHLLKGDLRTVTGKENDEDDDDEPPPTLPPPLPTRLHSRLFSRTNGSNLVGYDSGHESGSPRPTKIGPPLLGRPGHCESSGYESFPRDSECSSLGSSHDFNPGVSTSRGSMDDSKKVAVLQYCREDVERLERRWSEARGGKIRELKQQQQELKTELEAAKNRLLIPPSRWSFELHVEASMDQREPSFVEALERETLILRKRVEACKSRILIVTCFDSVTKPPHD